MTDVLTAAVLLGAILLGGLFLEVLLDHFLPHGLPAWFRMVALVLGFAGALTFAAYRIALPLLRSVNGLYAARTIEQTDPNFKNSLINYLDLRRRRSELPKSVMAAVENKAVNDLTRVDVDAVVNQRRLIQMFYTLAGVVVVVCVYSLLTPKPIFDSVRRACSPTSPGRRTRGW